MNRESFYRFALILCVVAMSGLLIAFGEQQRLKSRLESLGVTVERNGYGLVASLPQDMVQLAGAHLHKYGIDQVSYCDLGQCGMSVQGSDYLRAAKLLQQIKPQLQEGLKSEQLGRVWVWEIRPTNVQQPTL